MARLGLPVQNAKCETDSGAGQCADLRCERQVRGKAHTHPNRRAEDSADANKEPPIQVCHEGLPSRPRAALAGPRQRAAAAAAAEGGDVVESRVHRDWLARVFDVSPKATPVFFSRNGDY
jgi:hypothetical protein